MKSFSSRLVLALASLAIATPVEENILKRATPNVYLAGDSTMAKGGGGSGTDGTYPLLSIPSH